MMGIVPTGSNVKRQVSYPSPVSASDRGIFYQIQPKPHPFLKENGAAGVPEEQQAVLDHFEF